MSDGPFADLPAWSDAFHAHDLAAPRLGIDIDRAWAYGDGSGRGVRVAVIDSGVDAGHPRVQHVAEYVAVVLDDDEPDGVRFEREPHDDLYGHGTACAGIIRGLAPEIELVSVRVLGTSLKGSSLAFAHAIDWCLDHGVQVANMSLSTTNERLAGVFHDLVDAAAFGGMLLVSAMNNTRKRSIPSEYAGVFSVACAPGTDPERVWCNPTGPAEWGACGIGVEVAWSGGGTTIADGNSFAAPVVSGHLARIVGTHPGLAPWQVRTVLAALAVNRG